MNHDTLKGCGLGCLASILIVVLLNAGLVLLAMAAVKSVAGGFEAEVSRALGRDRAGQEEAGVDEAPELDEVWSSGSKDGAKVARIAIFGDIGLGGRRDDFFGGDEGSAAFALDAIRAATRDEAVQAILLEIDSPGGGVTDSDILYDALLKFKAAGEGRAVFVLMGDLCASGGYYVAAAADYVMAHPTSTFGSIGVIMHGVNLKQLADKLGIREESIVSGPNKAMGGFTGDLSDEQKAILQSVVDASFRRFAGVVATGRNLSEGEVLKIADGRIFTPEQGLALHLIDGVGYYGDAVEKLCEHVGEESLYVFRYEAPASFRGLRGLRRILGAALRQDLADLRAASVPRRRYRYGD